MSVIGSNILAGASGGAGAGGYEIERSIRLNSADSASLNYTPSSAGNRKTWTWSSWVKLNAVHYGNLFSNLLNNSAGLYVFFYTGEINFNDYGLSGGTNLSSDAVFRDFSAWYHFVIVMDSTQATAADRFKLYVNGVQQTLSGTFPTQNLDGQWNNGNPHWIGQQSNGVTNYNLNSYLADVHFIDGQALVPTDFGEYDDNNVFQPKEFGGTYGTNGFHLDFSDNSSSAALGTDTSGNSNTWTVNNLSVIEGNGNYLKAGTISGAGNPSGYEWAKAFNGILSGTGAQPNSASQPTTFTFGSAISTTAGTVIVYCDLNSANDGTRFLVNGAYASTSNCTQLSTSGAPYKYRMDSVTSLVSVGNRHYMNFLGVEANGALFIDNSFSNTDSLRDSPSQITGQTDSGVGGEVVGNHAMWNPLQNGGNPLSNGNLDYALPSPAAWKSTLSTIGMSSGKWYWEQTYVSGAGAHMAGFCNASQTLISYATAPNGTAYYFINGDLMGVGAGSQGASLVAGDVMGIALDIDAGTADFYKNNVKQGSTVTHGITGTLFALVSNYNGNGSVNFGAHSFAYTAPSGYKALCVANLSDPTIADGSQYFDTKLWSGNGGTQSIAGYNFSPSFAWIKKRNNSPDEWHGLTDTVRGVTKTLYSNEAHQESTETGGLTAFNADGFSVGNWQGNNHSSGTYVGWAWDSGANSDKTYAITVANTGSGNKYYADGAQQPTLTLAEGSTYKFDQSSGTNSTHPLRFSTTSDGTHGGGSEYTTGVTTSGTPGSAGAYTQIVIAASAPTLYAYCTNHSGMGFQINTSDTAGYTIPVGSVSSGVPSIASRVQANPSAGFSIATFSGAGAATFGHGLNSEPSMVLLKARTANTGANDWFVYHKSLGNTKALFLNKTDTPGTYTYWTNTTPTNSVVSFGPGLGGPDWVAYCFAPVESFSSVGSYVGNGSADGPFVFTGMRPAFLLIKRSDAAGNWIIIDTARSPDNTTTTQLLPNLDGGDYVNANEALDIVSNGFKPRSASSGHHNVSGATYIYYAVAEHPFKSSRAR